jgi:hypothetical protein
MGRKTKLGNKNNAAQAAFVEAPLVALPQKDITQPTSFEDRLDEAYHRGMPFEYVLDRKERR